MAHSNRLLAIETVWGIICWFSFAVYVIFLVTIVKNRKKKPFNSAFFTICAHLSIYDLGLIVGLYIYRVQVYVELASDLLLCWRATYWYCQTAEHFSVLLLAANRFSSIVYPIRGKQFWDRHLNKTLVINAVWPLVFAIGITLAGKHDLEDHLQYDANSSIPAAAETGKWMVAMTAAMFLVNILCAICYAATVGSLIRHRSEHFTSTLVAEIRLAVAGMLLFLLLVVYAVSLLYFVKIRAVKDSNPDALVTATVVVLVTSELYAVGNPYMILVCSSACRRQFIVICGGLPIIGGLVPKPAIAAVPPAPAQIQLASLRHTGGPTSAAPYAGHH